MATFTSRMFRVRSLIFAAATLGLFVTTVSTKAPHFYPDDPIAREPESKDASKAQEYEIGSLFEMTHNLFVTAGYKPTGLRAKNINTIDEVPDSSWFTNRIGTTTISTDQIARGAIQRAEENGRRILRGQGHAQAGDGGWNDRQACVVVWVPDFVAHCRRDDDDARRRLPRRFEVHLCRTDDDRRGGVEALVVKDFCRRPASAAREQRARQQRRGT